MSAYLLPLAIFLAAAWVGSSLLKRFPPSVFLAVPAYSIVSKIASVAFLESEPTYLIETGLVSVDIGATERTIFYNSVILGVALVVLKQFASTIARRGKYSEESAAEIASSRELNISLRLVSVFLGAQLLNALASFPYPLPGSGISRQVFSQNLRFPIVAAVVGDLVIFAPICAAAAVALGMLSGNRRVRIQGIRISCIYALYLLIMGQRVNGGILVGGLWLATFVSVLWLGGRRLRFGRLSRRMAPIMILIAIVGQADVANRSFAEDADGPLDAVAYRVFALQGGVTYSAEFRASRGERTGTTLLVEDMSATRDVYMPANLAAAYERRGVNLAGSLHGNSVLSYGYFWGLAPLIAYGALLAGSSAAIVLALARGRFFALFPLSFLALRVIAVNAQGTFAGLLSLEFAALIMIALAAISTRRPTVWKSGSRTSRPQYVVARPPVTSRTALFPTAVEFAGSPEPSYLQSRKR